MRVLPRVLWVQKIDLDNAFHRSTVLNILSGLYKQGYFVQLITSYANKLFNHQMLFPVVQIVVPRKPILRTLVFYIKTIILIWKTTLSRQIDVIVLDKYTFFLAFPFDFLGRLKLIPTNVFVDFRDNLNVSQQISLRNVLANLLNFLGPLYASLAASGLSATTLKALQRPTRYPWATKNTCVFSSGVDVDIFDPQQVTPVVLPHVQEGDFILCYHGSINDQRGLLEIIEAISMLKDAQKIWFLVLGNGNFVDQFLDFATDKGVRNQIILLDSVPYEDVPSYLAAASMGILAYPNDPMWEMSSPLKLMEYLAMGMPVVLRNFEVFLNIVDKLPEIYTLPNNQPETIAQVIETLLAKPETLSLKPITSHRQRILQKYTWDIQVELVSTWLNSVFTKET